MGHLLFNCPEEHDTPGGCPCVESTGRQYPQATHPGPGGDQPAVQVVVNDN